MKYIKKVFCISMAAMLLSGLMCVNVSALSVSAQSAALMVVETGELIFGKDSHRQMSMASTTKIMTSLIALEACTPEREIIATDEMVMVEGTSMGLLTGDSVTLRALVCGMLLSSGNDAANTAAISLGGTAENFAAMMNARAREIGMTATNFVTPSGLDDDEHYSTAYDMALLGCEAIKNPLFRSICSKKSISVEYGSPPYRRTLYNHNRLLQKYEYCIGIKTGFTKKSGRCLVSAAHKDGVTLVAVTLKASDDWNDHIAMFKYGFERVSATALDSSLGGILLRVVGGTADKVPVKFASEPMTVLKDRDGIVTREILLKKFEYAPVAKGEAAGRVVYYQDGKVICEADLITDGASTCAMPRVRLPQKPQQPKGFFRRFRERLTSFFS